MQNKPYKGSVGDRLDRLPVSKFHTKFLLYVTGGEFIITFLVLLVGSLLAIISEVFHLSTDVSTYIMPTAFYSGMVVGTFVFGRLADIYGRRKIYFVNLLIFAFGAIIAGLMSNYILIGVFSSLQELAQVQKYP
jgi:Arabinose efflux permease